jgi:5-methylcytosine-specific restriction endonuclease McrA
MKGENNPNYKEGKYSNNHCIDCSKKIKQQRKRCKSCDIKWRKIEFSKNNNPNWKGGIGRLPYNYDFKYNRKLVLKRDNCICLKCGKKGNHVHHIDYDKQNSKLTNLATTCKKCNSEVNANRDYWFAYFTYILALNGLKED